MIRIATALSIIIATAVGMLVAVENDPAGAANGSASGEPVLVELFTSQGCSSCPPADRLAERLAQDPQLIVISRPVTYWDRLGWKDTLAREANTDLQRAYARRGLGGYNGVYTPQMVVNGAYGEVGSKEAGLRRLIARATGMRDAAIRIRGDAARGYSVGIAGTTEHPAELVLISVARRKTVSIGRGENRGREIGYTNVVLSERRIAGWNGGQMGLALGSSALGTSGADRHALVLREPDAGPILAAQWLD